MQDLDFDELDKAVNSLVQNTIPTLTADNEPEDTVLDLGSGDISLPDMPKPAITPVPNSAPVQTPLAGRRSNGRFMDVVPSSANTRVNSTTPERVSRQGVTLAPVDNNLPMVEEVVPVPVVIPETTSNPWPDPIDFQSNNNAESKESIKEDTEDADIDQISNDIANTLGQTVADEPQDSPFLTGAKVDKRPLGAFSSDQPVEQLSADQNTQPVNQDNLASQTNPALDAQPQTDTASVIPAELHPDLLSIESDSTTVPNVPSMEVVANNNVATEPIAPVAVVNPVVAVAEQPSGPASIIQQYTEKPSTGDQTTGAIYDTDSYHKAILTPTKKKSGWMIVLWITLLVVVGAGAGAAVYFFVLPR